MPWVHQGNLERRLLTGERLALNAWRSGKAWLLPSWSKGLYENIRAEDFIQAGLHVSVTLSLHILILTFRSTGQRGILAQMSPKSRVGYWVQEEELPHRLRAVSWCCHAFLPEQSTSSSSKQQEPSVAEEQLCSARRGRLSPESGPEGTHFILLLLLWVIYLPPSLFSSACPKASAALFGSDTFCQFCLHGAGRIDQGSPVQILSIHCWPH